MNQEGESNLHPLATFELAAGVCLEPFPDGTAILYSTERGETVSLNPTAALFCAYADENHTLEKVREEAQRLFPSEVVTLEPFLACARELQERGFLVADSR